MSGNLKITPSHFLLGKAQNFDANQLILTVRGSSDFRLGSTAAVVVSASYFRSPPKSRR
jgi:hypothetical protein